MLLLLKAVRLKTVWSVMSFAVLEMKAVYQWPLAVLLVQQS